MSKTLRYALISGFMTIAASLPAVAAESNIQGVFYSLSDAVRTKNTSAIFSNVTQNSQSTVNRLLGYNMETCLPADLTYAGERYNGEYVYVTASTPYSGGKTLTTELAFKSENSQWKLDVPESFRNNMGDNWEQQLGQIEMLYNGLQTQMGGQVNCAMLQDMLRNAPAGNTGSTFNIPGMMAQ